MISLVPTPSALERMIAARQACFCEALRSLVIASSRPRTDRVIVMEIPVRMRQTLHGNRNRGIPITNSPAAEKQLRAAGIEPAGGNAEALRTALKREIDKVNEVVKNAGIEPQ